MPLTFDLSDFERMAAKLGGATDQLPFALANAMTSAAFRTRTDLKDDVWPKAVNVRNKRFLGTALNIVKATKRNLRITIFDALGRAHLALNAKGGTKNAKGRLAIPTRCRSISPLSGSTTPACGRSPRRRAGRKSISP